MFRSFLRVAVVCLTFTPLAAGAQSLVEKRVDGSESRQRHETSVGIDKFVTRHDDATFGSDSAPSRGPALPILYAGLAALNAYDAYSTLRGVDNGAFESNPLMRPIADNRAAMWTVKSAAVVAGVAASEHLWRRGRRKTAIVAMIATNAYFAAVAANNARVLRAQR